LTAGHRIRLRFPPTIGKGDNMKLRYLLTVLLAVGLASCQTILKQEPAKGTLATGKKVLVDDGTCPAGQVKQVTGSTPGNPRIKECVPMPQG